MSKNFYEINNNNKPKVISVSMKKNQNSSSSPSRWFFFRPRISGLLEMVEEGKIVTKYGEVTRGNLVIYKYVSGKKILQLGIPLRNLNLRSCQSISCKCFTLTSCGEITPIATFRVKEDYGKWMKCIAAELIRQTPLQNIKYFDILTAINETKCKFYKEKENQITSSLMQQPDLTNCDHNNGLSRSRVSNIPDVLMDLPSEYENVTRLLKRWQKNKQYISVRDKKYVYESLNRFSYSVNDLTKLKINQINKCRSMYGLNLNDVSVKDKCRLFESNDFSHISLPSHINRIIYD